MTSAQVATPMLQDFLDAFNAHDVDAIMSFFAEDCVLDMPRGPAPGGCGRFAASSACVPSAWRVHRPVYIALAPSRLPVGAT